MASFDPFSKPLPTVKLDETPLIPPPLLEASIPRSSSQPPQLDSLPSFGNFETGLPLSVSASPIPGSASTSPSPEGRNKKSNPLTDLIETEGTFVEQLTGVIRKVAAAWSRTNLPPAELDMMFRGVEAVYKANKALLQKLREIGPNPSSPKSLGDLLMRWIDDLEAPYTAYCTRYCTGFDSWAAVQNNAKLPAALETFSEANPPPPATVWTLDNLFLLPKNRLKYYRKLYGRLLKSTAPGRSDHKLLVGAMDTLDRLLGIVDGRENVQVGVTPPPPANGQDEVVINMTGGYGTRGQSLIESFENSLTSGSASSSARGSTQSSNDRARLSNTSDASGRRGSMLTLISELERRLATNRTLDIFTMTPKAVRLQMAPPSLTYQRQVRFSADVTVSFTPRSTGVEVVHPEGHVFILTDLFLVAERMSQEEVAQGGPGGPDMYLCYPPLAGKVLRVSEKQGQDNVLQVSIMRKETLMLYLQSAQQRDAMKKAFDDCIEFACNGMVNSTQPLPPLPPINGGVLGGPSPPPSSTIGRSTSYTMTREINGPPLPVTGPANLPMTMPAARASAEQSYDRALPTMSDPPPNAAPREGMPNISHTSEAHQQGPPWSGVPPHPVFPARSASLGPQQFTGPVAPGQHFPPRSTVMGPPPGAAPPLIQPMASSPYPQQPLQQQQPVYMNNAPYTRQPQTVYNAGPQQNSNLDQRNLSMPETRSFSNYDQQQGQMNPRGQPQQPNNYAKRSASYEALQAPQPRPLLPSAQFRSGGYTLSEPTLGNGAPSPPASPSEENRPTGPVTNTITAQMKCKVFLQQQHAQWKNLGTAKLKLYLQQPTFVKQLVVEAENKEKTILISTIVLMDGVERVGKTGVAIELSDNGARTGIIYMIQLRSEISAGGLFDSLLAGSDRSSKHA